MTQPLNLQPGALAEYQEWLSTIKQRIVSVRLRMALAASRELILFYWDLGAMIAQKQAQSQWGDKLIAQLSADLQKAFPDIKGLSASNLKYCLRFFQFYTGAQGISTPDSEDAPIGQQPVDQLPWGHNIQIFTKCGSVVRLASRNAYPEVLERIVFLLTGTERAPQHHRTPKSQKG